MANLTEAVEENSLDESELDETAEGEDHTENEENSVKNETTEESVLDQALKAYNLKTPEEMAIRFKQQENYIDKLKGEKGEIMKRMSEVEKNLRTTAENDPESALAVEKLVEAIGPITEMHKLSEAKQKEEEEWNTVVEKHKVSPEIQKTMKALGKLTTAPWEDIYVTAIEIYNTGIEKGSSVADAKLRAGVGKPNAGIDTGGGTGATGRKILQSSQGPKNWYKN